jgi:NADH dehydrogenase FAD-containing subunit
MISDNCPSFKYYHRGSMAQIGRERAVVDLRNVGKD